jgi:predicted acetyltransferase
MSTGTGQNISIEIVDSSQKPLNRVQVDFISQWGEHFYGSLPMTTKYRWTGAKETRFNVFIYKDDEIVTRLPIISRKAQIDNEDVSFGGIGGVMTAPAHHGKGFATLALREAERLIFQVVNARLGVLLCLPELVPFYQRFGVAKSGVSGDVRTAGRYGCVVGKRDVPAQAGRELDTPDF